VRGSARGPAAPQRELLLYLDQNYLSGIVKRKVAFRKLEPVLRAAVARGSVAVPESEAHRLESAARPDLPILELLRELSAGLRLPNEASAVVRSCERRLEAVLERDFPTERPGRATVSTSAPSRLLCRAATSSRATPSWPMSCAGPVSTSASAALFTGRRADVERLRRRLKGLSSARAASRRA
jgi:hypothetical protein